MNFINCAALSSNETMRNAVIFWSENTAEHIKILLRSNAGTTAILEEGFKEQLKLYYEKFTAINQGFKSKALGMTYYSDFLRTNAGFINLLERIKYEGFSGYPILQQSVFHYIYEGRYINAVFGTKNIGENVLITTRFLPFLNNALNCVYNQTYFWSIIGSMHPSLLMGNNAFYNAINGYAKEFLTEICNGFNNICFRLSQTKKPIKKSIILPIFENFKTINNEYIGFLTTIKQTGPKIFTLPSSVRLPVAFYEAVEHQIAEHNLVAEINGNTSKLFGV